MDIPVTIKLLSPTHLGSGRADVNLDQDVVTDRLGIPFFPGRRFKGLLYESLLEVADMGASGLVLCTREEADTLFHHGRDDGPQMLVPDFHLDEYDELKAGWAYLEENYQEWFTAEEVLEEYSSIRYQTAINEKTGTAEDGSLRNLRVIDSGLSFHGTITILDGGEKERTLLALALANLKSCGTKRNRGFGAIECTMPGGESLVKKAVEAAR